MKKDRIFCRYCGCDFSVSEIIDIAEGVQGCPVCRKQLAPKKVRMPIVEAGKMYDRRMKLANEILSEGEGIIRLLDGIESMIPEGTNDSWYEKMFAMIEAIRISVRREYESCSDPWNVRSGYIPVGFVHRDDIKESGFDADVSDDVLVEIGKEMQDCFLNQGYWEALKSSCEKYGLKRK